MKLVQILHGVNLGTFDEIDNDYCDDVEILVEDENDLIRAKEIFTKFESFSGARLNREITEEDNIPEVRKIVKVIPKTTRNGFFLIDIASREPDVSLFKIFENNKRHQNPDLPG